MPDAAPQSESATAFELLAPGVQKQLYRMGWTSLRPIQASAIRAVLQSSADILITAETAGGKTEAAFLPLLSLISQEPRGSVRALYVGPLKALINDQFIRLEDLCEHLDVPVYRWHGDVSDAKKKALIQNPGGVLLITPESLESLLINRTSHLARLFGGLRAVVIDEVHAFLETERGLHLASLLSRLRRYQAPDEPRWRVMGLSATVGDIAVAQTFCNPDRPENVTLIRDDGDGKELQFRLHGYEVDTARSESMVRPLSSEPTAPAADDSDLVVMGRIAADLVEHCRTHANLVFANAKGDIEIYADLANEICRDEGLPEAFIVHHGSLAKEVREDTEQTMKSGHRMTTICSSTLEMGVDIGSVRMVGQIGAPWSVASLRQRMGRSGRREDEPRRLRLYIDCSRDQTKSDPLADLPLDLLQATAVCELMLRKWLEPPRPARLDLSTLLHQVISTIAETGAIRAEQLHERLCVTGPFRSVSSSLFARLLRQIASKDVVEQSPEGSLILGLEGERIRARRDFYAAFASRIEFTILAGDRPLGTLPMETAPKVGDHLVFAARRWQILEVDFGRLVILVSPAKRRKRPAFLGSAGEIHSMVREEMRSLLEGDHVPIYLNAEAQGALAQARASARAHGIATRCLIPVGEQATLWLTWAGTAAQRTLIALLEKLNIDATDRKIAIHCGAPLDELRRSLASLIREQPGPIEIAQHVALKQYRKFDYLLEEDLLDESIASDRLDIETACRVVQETASVH